MVQLVLMETTLRSRALVLPLILMLMPMIRRALPVQSLAQLRMEQM
nr:MAG TPA: hypothetical protein [Caudoviricetes sp.]